MPGKSPKIVRKKSQNFQREIQKFSGRNKKKLRENLKVVRKKSQNQNLSKRNPEIFGKKSYSSPRKRLLENRCGVQCYELLIGRNRKFQHKSKRGRASLKGRLSFKLRNLIRTWIKSHQSNSFTNYDRQRAQWQSLCQKKRKSFPKLFRKSFYHHYTRDPVSASETC